MDFLKKNFERAKQSAGEMFGEVQRTEYEPEFQALLNKADDIKQFSEHLLKGVQQLAQPDPAARMLPTFNAEGANKAEVIAEYMQEFNDKVKMWPDGNNSALAAAMNQGIRCFVNVGKAEREYLTAIKEKFVIPMQRFLREDMHEIDEARRSLHALRLDMDAVKNKNTSEETQKELEKRTKAFEEQKDKVRDLIIKVEGKQGDLHKSLKAFVELHEKVLHEQYVALQQFAKTL